MLKAVIFDMDGTLLDTEKVYRRAWRVACDRACIDDADTVIKNCTGRNRADIRKYFERTYGADFPFDEFISVRESAFDRIIEQEGIDAKEGMKYCLDYLKENGIKIGLATSTNATDAEQRLRMAGAFEYFDAIVTGDCKRVKKGKPAPDIFLAALDALGVTAEEAIAVEDSLNGVRSAVSAGMRTVMIPDFFEPDTDTVSMLWKRFDTLTELRDMLCVDRNI